MTLLHWWILWSRATRGNRLGGAALRSDERHDWGMPARTRNADYVTRCLVGLAIASSLTSQFAYAEAFSDTDLATTLSHRHQGLIYVWSPHMPYSVKGAREASEVAGALGLTLILALDPYADPRLAERARITQALPVSALRRLRAGVLLERGVTQHFPTLITFKDGRLDAGMLPGYTPPDDLAAYIKHRLDE